MSNKSCRLGGRLILKLVLLAGIACAGGSLHAQAQGSQAGNIPFAQAWQVPAGFNELNDYFAAPGYITMLELWGIN